MVAAFKILTSDHQVKALLVNIFGAALPVLQPWKNPLNPRGIQRAWCPHAQKCIPSGGRRLLPHQSGCEPGDVAYLHVRLELRACGRTGGIMKCDVIAAGIVSAAKEVRPCFTPLCRADQHDCLSHRTCAHQPFVYIRLTPVETCRNREVWLTRAATEHLHGRGAFEDVDLL